MQMQHRSEFFGLCFLILSGFTVWIQNAKGFVYCLHVKVAFLLSQLFITGAFEHIQSLPWTSRCRHQALPSCPLVWLVHLLLQRNIPMKSAKNAMRLMWWPPSETVEEDQCCGQSQVPGLYPAVCLSELPWWTPILSSVCLGRVFFFLPLEIRGERGWERRREEGKERGKRRGGWGMKKVRRCLGGWMKGKRRRWREGRVYRLLTGWGGCVRGLAVDSQDPWPFSALWPCRNTETHERQTQGVFLYMCVCLLQCMSFVHLHIKRSYSERQEKWFNKPHPTKHTHTHTLHPVISPTHQGTKKDWQAKQDT